MLIVIEGLWGAGKTTTVQKLGDFEYKAVAEPDHNNILPQTDGLAEGDPHFFNWYIRAYFKLISDNKDNFAVFERCAASTIAYYQSITNQSKLPINTYLPELRKIYSQSVDLCINLTFSSQQDYIRRLETLPDQKMAKFLQSKPKFVFNYSRNLKNQCEDMFHEKYKEVLVANEEGFLSTEEIIAQIQTHINQKGIRHEA